MRRILLLALATVLLSAAVAPAAAQSVVTYTGQLLSGSSALSGTYDFQFQLYDAPTIGNAVGPLLTETSVHVAGGVFYTELNFGKVFTGKTLYLQTAYRIHPSSGSPAYTVQPVRKLAPVSAYSVYAPLSGNTKALQGKTISSSAPAANQVLTWSGTAWTPADPLAGPQGPQGPAGATGPKGSTGATGPQGPAGTPGTTFTAGTGLSLSSGTLKVAVPLSLSGSSSSPIVSAANTGSGYGVSGSIANEKGVLGGVVTVTAPIFGTVTVPVAVYGSDTGSGSKQGYAVMGVSSNSNGVVGVSNDARADLFTAGAGVVGVGLNGSGVLAFSVNNSALYAQTNSSNTSTLAGEFNGDVSVYSDQGEQGNLTVQGTINGAFATSKIDHPLDPENKYLSHASVESDQMMDIYAGHVTLDKAGTAVVLLPDWFEALNGDFEYHLTAVGAPGPNLYVAQEIKDGRFTIAGGKPGSKVSWQVTGVRHDAFALGHPLDVEQDKPDSAKGTYLDPKDFGQPESRGENYARHARTRARWLPSLAQP